MLRQIKLLNSIYLCNVLGLNEARFSKDKKKRNRAIGMFFTYLFLGLILAFYTGAMAVAYTQVGLVNIIPSYMYTITSLIIMFFTIIKSGSVIFNMQSYERTITLPVKSTAIVISRFISMYTSNLVLSLIVMLPSSLIYAYFAKPDITFFIMLVVGTIFLPLLPITIATAIGALILAISSRMKHKSIATVILSMVFTVGVLVFSMSLSYGDTQTMPSDFSQISNTIVTALESIYPPVKFFSDSLLNGNWISFIILILISVVIFSLLIFLIDKRFVAISTALNSTASKRNYVMNDQKQNSQLRALFNKEMKRYFSCAIYVSNTAVGYVMMIMFSIAVLVMGIDKISSFLPSPDILTKLIPVLLIFMCVLSPSTTSCISIEGKQWWIIKSLPIDVKTIFNSKLLVTFVLAIPSLVITTILLIIALKPTVMQAVWMFVLPLVYILFSAVLGLTVNIKHPVFNWDNETQIVKQGSAVLYSMLIGMVVDIIPAVIIFTLSGLLCNIALAALCVILLCVTYSMYSKDCKIQLTSLD